MALSSDWSSRRSKFMSSLLNIQPRESLHMGRMLVSKSRGEKRFRKWREKKNIEQVFVKLRNMRWVQACRHHWEQRRDTVNITVSRPSWRECGCLTGKDYTHTPTDSYIAEGLHSRPAVESELSEDLRSLLASRWRTPNQSFSLAARLWSSASVQATHAHTHTHTRATHRCMQ